MSLTKAVLVSVCFAAVLGMAAAIPQAAYAVTDDDVAAYVEKLRWRNIGPKVGGRSIAAAGSSARPLEAYFGATGGGLWKTKDGGMNWRPVTDGQIASSSVGAVSIAPSNPDIVYLGMGEGQLRGNVMQGDGMYKSVDSGRTWTHIGLGDTQTITTIRIHPRNPDLVYVTALGDPFAPNEERGVYRTRDGGETWEKILYRSDEAGAIDISMDPNNPNVLFATIWQVYRKPWKLWSGGPQSGMFKSVDGGDTWTEITRNPGLPTTVLGKMTVAVSGADSNRVYANIEAEAGGLYRSDDSGATWKHINGHRKLWQRSFYFMQVRPDPRDRDTVYVLSFKLEKSVDGGETFRDIPTRHVDIHDLWIDPEDTDRMVVADDGGGSMTFNGGGSWTEQDYATAQMYRVTTTNDFPYHVCGSQQDNFTFCVPSRSAASVGAPLQAVYEDRYTIGFSEMGYVAPHPQKLGVFFVGATNSLMRFDRASNRMSQVNPYPYIVMGQSAGTMRERWNWTYPIVFSNFKPYTLYAGSQHLWRSRDEGETWTKISPDLTRAAPETLGDTGGPIMFDQDGPEVYATLYTIAPSRLDKKVIWTGSDDGLIHVTRNGGDTWANVTPPGVPENSRISFIDASSHEKGAAYVAVKRYEMGDRAPYLWKTKDYGATWSRIDDDIPDTHFAHAIRADTERQGLLFAGTEHGVQVSFDDGGRWSPLSLNLPDVHVSALEVKGDDLVIATHGRSFYVLDDGASLLRQLPATKPLSENVLFKPAKAYRRIKPAEIYFYVKDGVEGARFEILDEQGSIVRKLFSNRRLRAGMQKVRWNLRYDGAAVFKNMILESPSPAIGPLVAPGIYQARLTVGDTVLTAPLDVVLDPRMKGDISRKDLRAQAALALEVRDAVDVANKTIIEIRSIRTHLEEKALSADDVLSSRITAFSDAISDIEAELYQVKNTSPKDKIALPIKLNDRLAGLLGGLSFSDGPPTRSQYDVFEVLRAELDVQLSSYAAVKSGHSDLLVDYEG